MVNSQDHKNVLISLSFSVIKTLFKRIDPKDIVRVFTLARQNSREIQIMVDAMAV